MSGPFQPAPLHVEHFPPAQRSALRAVAGNFAAMSRVLGEMFEVDPKRGTLRVRGSIVPRIVQNDPSVSATFGTPRELISTRDGDLFVFKDPEPGYSRNWEPIMAGTSVESRVTALEADVASIQADIAVLQGQVIPVYEQVSEPTVPSELAFWLQDRTGSGKGIRLYASLSDSGGTWDWRPIVSVNT